MTSLIHVGLSLTEYIRKLRILCIVVSSTVVGGRFTSDPLELARPREAARFPPSLLHTSSLYHTVEDEQHDLGVWIQQLVALEHDDCDTDSNDDSSLSSRKDRSAQAVDFCHKISRRLASLMDQHKEEEEDDEKDGLEKEDPDDSSPVCRRHGRVGDRRR